MSRHAASSSSSTPSGPVTYEVVVRGRLGPVLRDALSGPAVTAVEPCSVIRVHVAHDRDLTDVVGVCARAHLPIQEVHLVPEPAQGPLGPLESPHPDEAGSGRADLAWADRRSNEEDVHE